MKKNMTYVVLPSPAAHGASFYLATEEYIARNMAAGDYFFTWQVEPSVVVGRNQATANEVDLDYCAHHNIAVVRRKSGGGCIYADRGNVMLSLITDSDNVPLTYSKYTAMVLFALQRLGIDARADGRNDILVDGKKVSGSAYYRLTGRSIVHGTMLFDTDMAHMTAAITPSKEKLRGKGVASVRQRIALLKDYIDVDIDTFKTFVRGLLCTDSITLNNDDVRQIRQMEREYTSDSFRYGRKRTCNTSRRQHIEGVGEIALRLKTCDGAIESLDITGDFFALDDVERRIIRPLTGTALTRETLTKALPDNTEEIIAGLTKDCLIRLLLPDDGGER